MSDVTLAAGGEIVTIQLDAVQAEQMRKISLAWGMTVQEVAAGLLMNQIGPAAELAERLLAVRPQEWR